MVRVGLGLSLQSHIGVIGVRQWGWPFTTTISSNSRSEGNQASRGTAYTGVPNTTEGESTGHLTCSREWLQSVDCNWP